jgi:hypothetical protein
LKKSVSILPFYCEIQQLKGIVIFTTLIDGKRVISDHDTRCEAPFCINILSIAFKTKAVRLPFQIGPSAGRLYLKMDQHTLDKDETSQATTDNMDSPENAFINAEKLNSIIENEQIITHFQPIISLKSRLLIGFEALSRGLNAEGNKTIQPDILFASDFQSAGKAFAKDRKPGPGRRRGNPGRMHLLSGL